MQLFVLALILVIFAHDSGSGSLATGLTITAKHWLLFIGMHVALAVMYLAMCKRWYSMLGRGKASAALRQADVAAGVYRSIVLAFYVLGIWLGTLQGLRQALGDLVLADELLVMFLPLAMMAWSWWAYYPIDLRLREAPLIRHLDQGASVQPVWSRGEYLLSQLRHQVALTLVPLLTLMAGIELIDRYTPRSWLDAGLDPRPALMLLFTGAVFVLAPVMIRYIWDTTPLPAGELRERLLAMCRRYNVGVRQLLLWRTFGGVVNAAVMGLIAPVRYILLSDALLEQMPGDRVEAVMAHELAHVRRHHMFWLAAVGAGSLIVLILAWAVVVEVAAKADGPWLTPGEPGVVRALADDADAKAMIALTAAAMSWVFVFGWVSRRFERQADTFAVQHMTKRSFAQAGSDPPDVIDAWAIGVMSQALQQIADLNHLPTTRRSWRHGSIAWRQTYLRSLLGTSLNQPLIDRQVQAIKLAAGVVVLTLALLQGLNPQWHEQLSTWLG
jgi:STE24 endopeptidase